MFCKQNVFIKKSKARGFAISKKPFAFNESSRTAVPGRSVIRRVTPCACWSEVAVGHRSTLPKHFTTLDECKPSYLRNTYVSRTLCTTVDDTKRSEHVVRAHASGQTNWPGRRETRSTKAVYESYRTNVSTRRGREINGRDTATATGDRRISSPSPREKSDERNGSRISERQRFSNDFASNRNFYVSSVETARSSVRTVHGPNFISNRYYTNAVHNV